MRVGVLGGTFDPIHLGHLLIAEEVRVKLNLERVIFMPAGQPRLRAEEPVSPVADRLRMVELAVASNPHFETCLSEIRRSGPTYTVATLEELHQQLGASACLFFIVGEDVLEQFHRWKDPERVLELCHLVVVTRPGREDFDWTSWAARFSRSTSNTTRVSTPQIDISGSEIRRRSALGQSLRYLVPDPVAEYIQQRGLYGSILPGKD